MRDANGTVIRAGDKLRGSYGIPPVLIIGAVDYARRGTKRRLIVHTPGHKPGLSYLTDFMAALPDAEIMEES